MDEGHAEAAELVGRRVIALCVALALGAAALQSAVALANNVALDYRYDWLDPDGESTPMAWASGAATFGCAFAAAILACVDAGLRRAAVIGAALLAFFSLDDMLSFHERLSHRLFVERLDISPELGDRLFAVGYLPLLASALLSLVVLARRGPTLARRPIVVGLCCLAAAVGLEVLNGGLSALDVIASRSTGDAVLVILEEGLELAGWILVAGGLTASACIRLVELGARDAAVRRQPVLAQRDSA